MWDMRMARDLAWANADLLQALGVPERTRVIEALNKLTGVASRALLLPLQ